jgi:hypothetical protein
MMARAASDPYGAVSAIGFESDSAEISFCVPEANAAGRSASEHASDLVGVLEEIHRLAGSQNSAADQSRSPIVLI